MTDPKKWMVIAIRRNLLERAGAIGVGEAQYETDRGLERAGLNARCIPCSTQEAANEAGRALLRRLLESEPGAPWAAFVLSLSTDHSEPEGRSYEITLGSAG